VVARALPELGGALVVMLERLRGNKRQAVAELCHRYRLRLGKFFFGDPYLYWAAVMN
jgi:hypothetical protein